MTLNHKIDIKNGIYDLKNLEIDRSHAYIALMYVLIFLAKPKICTPIQQPSLIWRDLIWRVGHSRKMHGHLPPTYFVQCLPVRNLI